MDTRQQRKRMSSENRGQTGLGYVESRLRKTIVNPTVSTDDWYTPRWIIDALGPFDLDPCAPPIEVRPYEIAPTNYTRDDDGLSREWHGTVWMNPPYSRELLRRFCDRMAAHGNGTTGSPFFGSCLVAWGDTCDRRLRGSGIEGKYVVLNM